MSLRTPPSKFKLQERDCYFTPAHAVHSLLCFNVEHGFLGFKDEEIWECAAGDGFVAQILKRSGLRVFASDIHPDENCVIPVATHDFLKSSGLRGGRFSIVTNPPYGEQSKLILAFIAKGFEHMAAGKALSMALLLPFEFDSRLRRNELCSEHPYFVAKVTCKTRMRWRNLKQSKNAPMGAHSWFIWSTDVGVKRRAAKLGNMVVR